MLEIRAGYYYIPGTDTCVNIGGYARVDYYYNASGTFNPAISSAALKQFNAPGAGIGGYPLITNDSASSENRARGLLNMETRSDTEYGVVRSVIRFGMQWDSTAQPGAPAGGSLYWERAFIQFAGITAGYTTSFFNTGAQAYYIYSSPYAGDAMWNTVLGYTADFGGGFTASIALEDAANRTTGIQAAAPISAYSAGGILLPTSSGMSYVDYQAGLTVPDLVGNLRLDQAWGTLQVSGGAAQCRHPDAARRPGNSLRRRQHGQFAGVGDWRHRRVQSADARQGRPPLSASRICGWRDQLSGSVRLAAGSRHGSSAPLTQARRS